MLSLRYDLSTSSARDAESILLALRAKLAAANVRAPAFDLAFAYYWAQTHPGQHLTEYLSRSTVSGRASEMTDLGSIMQDALNDIVGQVADVSTFGVAGAAFRLTKGIAATVSRRLDNSKILRNCKYLSEALNEVNMVDLRMFLPHFLAWDLHQAQMNHEGHAPARTFVVFFDSWEDVQADSGYRGCLEDVLSQLVFLMPNVLFVITGRERLRWAEKESAAYLTRSGPNFWPGLALSESGEKDQHLLGTLSHKDSLEFLHVATAARPIEPDLLDALVAQSGGHPDYLDAIIDLWQGALTDGSPLTIQSVSGGLPQVYQRVFRGLPPLERDLLLAASLVPVFSEEILSAMVPQATPLQITGFLHRHFIESTMSDWLEFRLRSSVAELVTASRNSSIWFWSSHQVRSALSNAVNQLLASCLTLPSVATLTSNIKLDQAIKFVISLERTGAELPPRTVDLIFAANVAGSAGRLFETEFGGESSYFSNVLRSVIALESSGVPSIGHPSDHEPRWLVDTHQVSIARHMLLEGNLSGCSEVLSTITDSTPTIAHRRSKLEILLASRSGELIRGRKLAENWTVQDERSDLLGHIALWQGDFVKARNYFQSAADFARSAARDLEYARGLRHQARVEAIMDHPDVESTLSQAQKVNLAVDSSIGLAQIEGTRGIVAARGGDTEASSFLLHMACRHFEESKANVDIASLCVSAVLSARLVSRTDLFDEWHQILDRVCLNEADSRLYRRTIAFVNGSIGQARQGLARDYDDPVNSARAWFEAATPRRKVILPVSS